MKLNEIQDLIKFVAKQKVTEVEIEHKDFKIIIKSELPKTETTVIQTPMAVAPAAPVTAPVAPAPAATNTEAAPTEENDSNLITIKSPMIGTFYRSSSPEADSFVNIGDTIKKGDVICIVEAMKLFNEIEAEVSGKIVKVLVDDASPIEFDQPLFLIEP